MKKLPTELVVAAHGGAGIFNVSEGTLVFLSIIPTELVVAAHSGRGTIVSVSEGTLVFLFSIIPAYK